MHCLALSVSGTGEDPGTASPVLYMSSREFSRCCVLFAVLHAVNKRYRKEIAEDQRRKIFSETLQKAIELTAVTISNRPRQGPTKTSGDARTLFSRWNSQMAARSRRLSNDVHIGINALQVGGPISTADQIMLGRQIQGAADEESRLEYFPPYKMALISESKQNMHQAIAKIKRWQRVQTSCWLKFIILRYSHV